MRLELLQVAKMQFAQIAGLKTLVVSKILTTIYIKYILLFKMNYSKRDVLIGFIIIFLIVAGALYYKKIKNPENIIALPSPVSAEYKKTFENNFKYDIPDNANLVELKDISGGNGKGIATSNETLADLDNPEAGYFYQAWVEQNGELVSLGKLFEGKGGWIIEYPEVKEDGNKKIIVSLEKTYDSKVEKKILEGSFK